MTNSFHLLETLRVERGTARDLSAHVDRMTTSARELGFVADADRLTASMLKAAASAPAGAWRLRVLLDRGGHVETQLGSAPAARRRLRVALADRGSPPHPLAAHKTTAREHLIALGQPGADDTLLFNEDGEFTEFTYGNVVARVDGRLVTPPLRCGLLPGVERRRALGSGRVSESVVSVDDLGRVEELWHLNSLRGWTRVHLEPRPDSRGPVPPRS